MALSADDSAQPKTGAIHPWHTFGGFSDIRICNHGACRAPVAAVA